MDAVLEDPGMQAVRVKAMAMVEQAAGDALQALQQPSYP